MGFPRTFTFTFCHDKIFTAIFQKESNDPEQRIGHYNCPLVWIYRLPRKFFLEYIDTKRASEPDISRQLWETSFENEYY